MSTFKWFLWLKKQELKNFIVEYWQFPVFILVVLAIIYAGTFLPIVCNEKFLIQRVMLSALFLIFLGLFGFMVYAAISKFVSFIKNNWKTAQYLEASLNSYKDFMWCEVCKSVITARPSACADGTVDRLCKCKDLFSRKWRPYDKDKDSIGS